MTGRVRTMEGSPINHNLRAAQESFGTGRLFAREEGDVF